MPSKPKSVTKTAEAPANFKFRGNLKAPQLKALLQMKQDGEKWKAILKATGLSHSKAELAFMEHEAFTEADPAFTVVPLTPEFVSYARNVLGIGWGPIMVWTQSTEGAVRKAWEVATGTHAECKRVGRGGRFKFDDQELYVGELKPRGTDVPAEAPLMRTVARENALTTRLGALEPKALMSIYEKATGKKPTRGWTKAKIILELAKLNEAKAVQVG
jgi:hypothetical protein